MLSSILVACFVFGRGHGKLAPEKTFGIKDQSFPMLQLSHKGMCNVAAHITRSEDELNLILGNALGAAKLVGIQVCYRSTRKTEGSKR